MKNPLGIGENSLGVEKTLKERGKSDWEWGKTAGKKREWEKKPLGMREKLLGMEEKKSGNGKKPTWKWKKITGNGGNPLEIGKKTLGMGK